jgi:hypothetical protein
MVSLLGLEVTTLDVRRVRHRTSVWDSRRVSCTPRANRRAAPNPVRAPRPPRSAGDVTVTTVTRGACRNRVDAIPHCRLGPAQRRIAPFVLLCSGDFARCTDREEGAARRNGISRLWHAPRRSTGRQPYGPRPTRYVSADPTRARPPPRQRIKDTFRRPAEVRGREDRVAGARRPGSSRLARSYPSVS